MKPRLLASQRLSRLPCSRTTMTDPGFMNLLLGEELRTLSNDLRLVMSAISKPEVASAIRVSSKKQEDTKGQSRKWTADILIQTAASSLKGLRHVLQEFIHFLGSSCLLSGSQSERPSTAGLTVGQLVANLWKNMIQTRDRMDDVKSQLEYKCSLVETKNEEVVMLRTVLAQQKVNHRGSSVSMSHMLGGLSSTAVTSHQSVWETQERQACLASASASSVEESLSRRSERTVKTAADVMKVSVVDVSCQTVETEFGQCNVCTDTASCLLGVHTVVAKLFDKYGLTMSQKAKWLKAGIMSSTGVTKWMSSWHTDLETMDNYIQDAQEREALLETELVSKEKTLIETLAQTDDLQLQIEQLELSLNQIRNDHQTQLRSIRDEFSRKKHELEALNKRLEDQLKEIRANEHKLEAALDERMKSCHNLEVEVSTLRDEVASKDCMVEEKRRLAADLLHVQNDLSITRASLEKHVKELGEVHGQNSWFSQQLQSSQSGNVALIQQLTTLEEECSSLQTKLNDTESSIEDLSSQLVTVQNEKDTACSQVDRLNQRSHQLQLEKKSLEKTMKRLKTETERLQHQVEEEKNKQQLLMDYPTPTGGMVAHPEQQIAANNVRIMLLEESNEELRAQCVPQQLDSVHEVKSPVVLWKQQNLSELQLSEEKSKHVERRPLGTVSSSLSVNTLLVSPPASPASDESLDERIQTTPSQQQMFATVISVPHLPAGSGRAAASRIRNSTQGAPRDLHSSSVPTVSNVGSSTRTLCSGDALSLMQRARKVARMTASADSRRGWQQTSNKSNSGGLSDHVS